MQDVMKLVRVASNRHLRNWEAPDALVQEIIPVASRTGRGQSCAVATLKIPVNVQRFSIHIYRYRSKGLETDGNAVCTEYSRRDYSISIHLLSLLQSPKSTSTPAVFYEEAAETLFRT